jgi:hypothetical protein
MRICEENHHLNPFQTIISNYAYAKGIKPEGRVYVEISKLSRVETIFFSHNLRNKLG